MTLQGETLPDPQHVKPMGPDPGCCGRAGRRPGCPVRGRAVRAARALAGCSQPNRMQKPASPTPAPPPCGTPPPASPHEQAENKESVNGPKMSLKQEGSDQISKVFFNAKGLVTGGVSERLPGRGHTGSVRRSHMGCVSSPGPAALCQLCAGFHSWHARRKSTCETLAFG